VYAAGGLVYALILATPWLVLTGSGFAPGRLLWLVSMYAWPGVLSVILLMAASWRDTGRIVGSYVGWVALVAAVQLLRSPTLSPGDLVFVWIFTNGPATLLLLAFLRRRVRAVGPMVFAFMTMGVAGAFVSTQLAASDAVLRRIVELGDLLHLGALELFVLMHIAGFVAFSALGWWILTRIGRAYRAKRVSDQSLTIDSVWLLFAVAHGFVFAFDGLGWLLAGVVAFVAYKLVTMVGFRFAQRAQSVAHAPMLLLLRVFALGDRSEQLFDRLAARYRRAGSICLIAGPDLLTATVEPNEFLDFLSGRLSRRFVQGEGDLDRRLRALDRKPDPDGRFRVNQFFCRADTWRMTMRRLAQESDTVLMDLRSFSQANHGCEYELQQLLDLVDLERVTLLVDETTDGVFLEQTLRDLWRGVDRDSPNRQVASPAVLLYRADGPSPDLVKDLLSRVLNPRSTSDQQGLQSLSAQGP
jgi:hypothetical protein